NLVEIERNRERKQDRNAPRVDVSQGCVFRNYAASPLMSRVADPRNSGRSQDSALGLARRVPRACQSRCKPWRNVMTALPSFHDPPDIWLANPNVLDAT